MKEIFLVVSFKSDLGLATNSKENKCSFEYSLVKKKNSIGFSGIYHHPSVVVVGLGQVVLNNSGIEMSL